MEDAGVVAHMMKDSSSWPGERGLCLTRVFGTPLNGLSTPVFDDQPPLQEG